MIFERGTLKIGVKADYRPWGFLCGERYAPCPEAAGEMASEDGFVIAGLEVDLARELSKHLSEVFNQPLETELVVVTSTNRLQRLDDAAVDVVIATMAETPARRQLADLLEPFYYASGVTALTPATSDVMSMQDLEGEPVCLTGGAFFNRLLVERYKIQPQVYRGTRDPLIALKTGKCVAYAYDDTALKQTLLRPGWRDYRLLSTSVTRHEWVVALPLGEAETPFGSAVRDKLEEWHRTGRLLALEERWGLGCSAFLVEAHLERGGDKAVLPAACAGVEPGGGAVLHAVADADRAQAASGFEAYHVGLLAYGFFITVVLSVGSIIGALALGLGGSALLLAVPGPIIRPLGALTVVFQTTPPLLQLYLVFFGLAPLLAQVIGTPIPPLAVALVVFSLYAGVAISGLISQTASNRGITDMRTFGAALPSLLDDAYAGIIAHLVNTVKAVGMAGVIAVPEVISAVSTVAAERGHTEQLMTGLLLFYLTFVWLVLQALKRARTRLIEWIRPRSSAT